MFTSVGIIGGGVMGEAFVKRLTESGAFAPDRIAVADPSSDRRAGLEAVYHVRTEVENALVAAASDLVIVAVKPQDAVHALESIRPAVAGKVVLSIMAGVALATLKERLGIDAVVRCMPNTPAQIGEGVLVWHADPSILSDVKAEVETLLRAFGVAIEVGSDERVDAATAVSGSGPAYVFDFIAHLIAAAQKLDFEEATATALVLATVKGAVALCLETGTAPRTLRARVTSKGGTTEAAFGVIDAHHLDRVYTEAIAQAYRRAREISATSP